MAGTHAPKGFGILFAIVGVPLIVWNAAGTSKELDALDTSSGTGQARIETCVTKTAKLVPDSSIRRQVCKCVVDKAAARGAFEKYGAYDEDLLEPIAGECLRGDWD